MTISGKSHRNQKNKYSLADNFLDNTQNKELLKYSYFKRDDITTDKIIKRLEAYAILIADT